ncbi:Zgc:91897 [Caligus rogercresseyi]|uniref:Zgc:91897 n=1 Tax=Caligus rogercresseyi TaxID=217165 RepID=A0A7T8QVK8_CALRO|nr:Zgc:91897 [Caligus rogercresseyi]
MELLLKACPPSSAFLFHFKSLILHCLRAIHDASHSFTMLVSSELCISIQAHS